MNSLDQYISLYDDHREIIESNAPAALNRWRHDARQALQGQSLPSEKTEGYERTSINAMMEPDLGININRLNFQADVAKSFRCDIPNMSTLLGIVVNDVFHPTNTLMKNLREGVIFDSISNVQLKRPDLLEKYYGNIAPLDNPAVALNTLLAQDGIFIYIPRGVKMEKTMQLVNIFHSDNPLLAFRRALIVVEDDARASLLTCDHTQGDDCSYISSQVVEIVLGRGAKLDLCDMEKSSLNTSRHSMTFVTQTDNSQLLLNTSTLTCGNTRNEIIVNIEGENCETRATGMAIATGTMHIDNNTTVNHRATHSHSDQLYKYVLEDEATGAFEGSIFVAPGAAYTEAYQSNKNLISTDRAKMHTKPQLEIYNDEVKCSHGASTGQLDTEALFYMRTRGIPEAEARNMLMQAFMIDVIDSVSPDSLRDRLRHLVEKRFSGDSASCENCNIK